MVVILSILVIYNVDDWLTSHRPWLATLMTLPSMHETRPDRSCTISARLTTRSSWQYGKCGLKTFPRRMPTCRQTLSKMALLDIYWTLGRLNNIQGLFDTMRITGARRKRQGIETMFWFANHAWNEDTQAEYSHCEPGWRYGDWQGSLNVFAPVWWAMWNVDKCCKWLTVYQQSTFINIYLFGLQFICLAYCLSVCDTKSMSKMFT